MIEHLFSPGVRRLVRCACLLVGAVIWWLLSGTLASHADEPALPGDTLVEEVAPAAAPVVETGAETVERATSGVETAVPPATELATNLAAQTAQTAQTAQRVVQQAAQPAVQQVQKSVVEPAVQQVVEPVVKSVVKVVQTVAKQAPEPAAQAGVAVAGAATSAAEQGPVERPDVSGTLQSTTPHKQQHAADGSSDGRARRSDDRRDPAQTLDTRGLAELDARAATLLEAAPDAATLAASLASDTSWPIAEDGGRSAGQAGSDRDQAPSFTPGEFALQAAAADRSASGAGGGGFGGGAVLASGVLMSQDQSLQTLTAGDADSIPRPRAEAPDHTPD